MWGGSECHVVHLSEPHVGNRARETFTPTTTWCSFISISKLCITFICICSRPHTHTWCFAGRALLYRKNEKDLKFLNLVVRRGLEEHPYSVGLLMLQIKLLRYTLALTYGPCQALGLSFYRHIFPSVCIIEAWRVGCGVTSYLSNKICMWSWCATWCHMLSIDGCAVCPGLCSAIRSKQLLRRRSSHKATPNWAWQTPTFYMRLCEKQVRIRLAHLLATTKSGLSTSWSMMQVCFVDFMAPAFGHSKHRDGQEIFRPVWERNQCQNLQDVE